MPKVTAAAAALLLVLALAGCGDDGQTGDASANRSSTTQTETPTPEGSEAPPLVAEDTKPGDEDAAFIAEARDRLAGLGTASTIPNATDEQLINAGHEACDLLIAGTPFNDVTVIEGEERVQGSYLDSAAIATAGLLHFCPEMNGKTN